VKQWKQVGVVHFTRDAAFVNLHFVVVAVIIIVIELTLLIALYLYLEMQQT